MALEDDVEAARRREVGGDLNAVRLHLVDRRPNQARHLAGMRRDDDVALFLARQAGRIVREDGQRIGVEHERHR